MPDDTATRLLRAHNIERQAVGVPPLVWSDALARAAHAWAERLAGEGRLAHAEDDEADPQGENLWAGTRQAYSPEQMAGAWIAEKRSGRRGHLVLGHYTQMVWRQTRSIGCAIAANRDDDYLVCRYSTPGNVEGEQPF